MRKQEVQEQLKRIGVNFQFVGRPELNELARILFDNEQLQHVVRGRYDGGWAILCATNQRVLLVDKKPFYLNIEDMRYEMIADMEFNHRLLDATIRLGTINKTLRFTSYSHSKLRAMTTFLQQQVMAFRQRQSLQDFTQQASERPVVQQQFTPQVQDVTTDQLLGQSAIQGILRTSMAVGPYSGTSPLTIRRRVSRYYQTA